MGKLYFRRQEEHYISTPIYIAPNGDDGESTPGTKAAPFKTIKWGVKELLNAVGGEHTIYVDGKLTEVQEIPSDFTKSMADFLTIKGTSGTLMIDANNNGPALTISTEVPVKIVNFTIKNGKTDSRDGGIYIDEKKADVTLGDGTVGGGVLITANEAKDGGGSDKNSTDARGGAIFMEGVYCYLGYDKANSEKEWTGKISGNSAVNGGGIYSKSAVITMNSGSIESNTADEKGSAVYEGDASQLTMGGKTSILPGNDQKNDVYLEKGKKITVSSPLESENIAALITLPDDEYKTETQVLAGDAVSSECYKFYVPNINGTEDHLFVLDDGKLAPIFTFPNGTPCRTQTNPDDSLE